MHQYKNNLESREPIFVHTKKKIGAARLSTGLASHQPAGCGATREKVAQKVAFPKALPKDLALKN